MGGPSGEFAELLLRLAKEAGFPLAGAVDVDLAIRSGELQKHVARYDEWLAQGNAGAMSYLERGRDRRADPRLVFPEAQSILCVGLPYESHAAGAADPREGVRYARYLHAGDYHKSMAETLERLMERVRAESGLSSLSWKVCVDTSAVLERSWAALAGLGWIGKNTLLINPRLGSYFFIGEVLLSEATGLGPAPLPEYCGHCERCLEGCPTGAISPERIVDSRRCISYLTLEKRGELPIAEEQKRGIGAWIAGCDLCQEVCPFNRKPARARADEVTAGASVELGATSPSAWLALLRETPEQYRERVRNSALKRVKPEQFSRNLAVALGNALANGAFTGPELEALLPEITRRLGEEQDAFARAEWARAHAYCPKRTP